MFFTYFLIYYGLQNKIKSNENHNFIFVSSINEVQGFSKNIIFLEQTNNLTPNPYLQNITK